MSNRTVNKIVIKKELDLVNYITRVVDIYAAMYYSRQNRLTDTELEVYVTYIVNSSKGIRPVSDEALVEFNRVMGMKRKGDIHTYLRKISAKKWLKNEKRTYTIPDIFKKIPEEFEISINLKLEE